MQAVRDGLYAKALQNRENRTFSARTMEEMVKISDEQSGFIKAMWCGDLACEEALKEKAGVTSRCMPFEQEKISEVCVCCGKPAKKMVYWGKAYLSPGQTKQSEQETSAAPVSDSDTGAALFLSVFGRGAPAFGGLTRRPADEDALRSGGELQGLPRPGPQELLQLPGEDDPAVSVYPAGLYI